MAGAAAMIRGRLEEDDPLQAEARFIALWQQGLEITAIAQRLGIPKGTVQSRAHRLQQRGLIQPRPVSARPGEGARCARYIVRPSSPAVRCTMTRQAWARMARRSSALQSASQHPGSSAFLVNTR
jgi:transposase